MNAYNNKYIKKATSTHTNEHTEKNRRNSNHATS